MDDGALLKAIKGVQSRVDQCMFIMSEIVTHIHGQVKGLFHGAKISEKNKQQIKSYIPTSSYNIYSHSE